MLARTKVSKGLISVSFLPSTLPEQRQERVYMGATYRYNPEDATVFRLLPVTDSDYLIQEITVRCVSVQ